MSKRNKFKGKNKIITRIISDLPPSFVDAFPPILSLSISEERASEEKENAGSMMNHQPLRPAQSETVYLKIINQKSDIPNLYTRVH